MIKISLRPPPLSISPKQIPRALMASRSPLSCPCSIWLADCVKHKPSNICGHHVLTIQPVRRKPDFSRKDTIPPPGEQQKHLQGCVRSKGFLVPDGAGTRQPITSPCPALQMALAGVMGCQCSARDDHQAILAGIEDPSATAEIWADLKARILGNQWECCVHTGAEKPGLVFNRSPKQLSHSTSHICRKEQSCWYQKHSKPSAFCSAWRFLCSHCTVDAPSPVHGVQADEPGTASAGGGFDVKDTWPQGNWTETTSSFHTGHWTAVSR